MTRYFFTTVFLTLFSHYSFAAGCGVKLGGAGKDSPWLKLKHNQITTISDIGGPWDFVRQTYGPCEFELYNKENYQGHRARYGEGITHRLRIGAKGGVDKNGWKARSLKIVPRKKNCRIELQANEVPGLSGQTVYRRQTFYGPSKIRNLTGWSIIGKIAEHCRYKIYNGANLDGNSIELKRLNNPRKLKWRIRSMQIIEVNASISSKRELI
ncbi:MAG: hypothetical protein KUG78_21950 [Kangiellaceae bacterium]|nr:hypothetical protein [Kangiellaceae bacterium]